MLLVIQLYIPLKFIFINVIPQNVEKAEKEVKRLEAEEDGNVTPSGKPATTNGHGDTKATAGIEEGGSIANEIELVKGAVADVVADLTGASIEDKKE
jgi:hypothetical protein